MILSPACKFYLNRQVVFVRQTRSFIVALFKAAVAKEKWGKNAKIEERVTNFFCFLNTYDPRLLELFLPILVAQANVR